MRDQRQRVDLARGDQLERRAHVGGPGRVAGGDRQLAQEQRRPSSRQRRARRGRRVQAQRPARSERLGGGRDRVRASACRRSPRRPARCRGARRPSACASSQARLARLAHPDRLDGPRVRGGDVQQPVDPGADDQQAVARAQAGAVLRAQHARQRLDERRGDRVHRVGQRAARRPARPARGPARRTRPGSRPVARKRSHSVSWPRRQRRHSPHGAWWWIATRVPGPIARSVRPARPRRRRAPPPASSWPSTAGSLRATYQSVTSEPHTPQASTPQTTSPGPGSGVGRLLDPDLARRERPGDPHGLQRGDRPRRPGSATPRSVTSAVTSAAGVTSNAGLRQRVPAPVSGAPPPHAPRRGRAPRSRSRRRSECRGRPTRSARRRRTGSRPRCAASARPYVPTLLATSPLAATRSQPTITASTSPAAISPAAAESTTSSCGIPSRRELPDRQPRALQQRPRLGGEHLTRASPVGELGDHGKRRARGRARRARRCCSGSGSRLAPREQVGAVAGDRVARGLLLGLDRARPPRARRPRGRRRRARAASRDAVDRPGEVDRRRAAPRAAASHALLERRVAGVALQLHREPVAGGDADQRRAADRQAPDRLRDLGGAREPSSRSAKAARVWSSARSAAPSSRSATTGWLCRGRVVAVIARRCYRHWRGCRLDCRRDRWTVGLAPVMELAVRDEGLYA